MIFYRLNIRSLKNSMRGSPAPNVMVLGRGTFDEVPRCRGAEVGPITGSVPVQEARKLLSQPHPTCLPYPTPAPSASPEEGSRQNVTMLVPSTQFPLQQ